MSYSPPSASDPATPPEPQPELSSPSLPQTRPRRRRSGLKVPLILGTLVIGGSAVALTTVPGLADSIRGYFKPKTIDVLRYPVKSVRLPVTVVERGSIESSNNKDVKSEVEGTTTIIMILPEGRPVEKDELVCELDSATLRDSLTNQEISTRRAEADLQQAQKTLQVAEIGVKEYEDGTFPESEQSAEGAIKLAESELIRAKERLDWSNRMLAIKYVTESQNMSDKLTLQKAEFSLREAQTKLKVLREYTREKQLKELQATVEKTRSDLYAKESTFNLEKEKEAKLRRQIEKCKLFAPASGLVVYANDSNRGGFGGSSQSIIEEGATVREQQAVFRLPDITKMRVNTKVHESMVDRVQKGLKAKIRVEAYPELLTGTVESVQPLPDPSNFMSSDIKVYTTLVTIDNPPESLRPGMSAEVEILVTQLDDVLAVPMQAILEFKGKDHVFVARGDGWERREVKKGINNEKLIEIKDGLKAGEDVALSPANLLTEAEKREAFSVAGKGSGMGGEWSPDAIKAGMAPGDVAAVQKGEGGPAGKGAAGGPAGKGEGGGPSDAAAKKGSRRGAGGGGMGGAMGAMGALMGNLSEEDRAKLRGASESEREAILRKAGATDEQLEQMKQFQRMREQGGGMGGGPGMGGGEGGGRRRGGGGGEGGGPVGGGNPQ
jgi:RND family efflux transporter MFP subunit